MYGTIARYRVKPGMEARMEDLMRQIESRRIPGFVADYTFRMDADPNEHYLAVLFDSKDAYVANANSPEQDAFYRQWRECLEQDPEWHDGEVLHVYELK